MRRELVVISIVLLAGVIVYADYFVSNCRIGKVPTNVPDLMTMLKDTTDRGGDYNRAARIVRKVDVQTLVDDCIRRLDAKVYAKGERPTAFIAYARDDLFVPGVSNEIEDKIMRRRNYVIVPGTGDTPYSVGWDYESWLNTVEDFAADFNSRVYQQRYQRK